MTDHLDSATAVLEDGVFSEQEWGDIFESLDVSPQQRRVVKLLFEGMADKQIARHLHVAFPTLRTHIARIFIHLGVHDRAGIMLRVLGQFRRRCQTCPHRHRRCRLS